MQTRSKTFGTISICARLMTLALITLASLSHTALAQQPTGNLQVAPVPDPTDAASKALALKGIVMISVLMDGAVVKQQEIEVSGLPQNFTLPVGVYDIRVEGAGVVTLVKRGLHVTAKDSTKVFAPMRAGQGVRTIEYATGGLAREEVAARLAKLEAAMAQMQKAK